MVGSVWPRGGPPCKDSVIGVIFRRTEISWTEGPAVQVLWAAMIWCCPLSGVLTVGHCCAYRYPISCFRVSL